MARSYSGDDSDGHPSRGRDRYRNERYVDRSRSPSRGRKRIRSPSYRRTRSRSDTPRRSHGSRSPEIPRNAGGRYRSSSPGSRYRRKSPSPRKGSSPGRSQLRKRSRSRSRSESPPKRYRRTRSRSPINVKRTRKLSRSLSPRRRRSRSPMDEVKRTRRYSRSSSPRRTRSPLNKMNMNARSPSGSPEGRYRRDLGDRYRSRSPVKRSPGYRRVSSGSPRRSQSPRRNWNRSPSRSSSPRYTGRTLRKSSRSPSSRRGPRRITTVWEVTPSPPRGRANTEAEKSESPPKFKKSRKRKTESSSDDESSSSDSEEERRRRKRRKAKSGRKHKKSKSSKGSSRKSRHSKRRARTPSPSSSSAVSSSSSEHEKSDSEPLVVVDELVRLFQKHLQRARLPVLESSPRRVSPTLPLSNGNLYSELGSYFSLEGREETIKEQIRGAASLFNVFMLPTTSPAEDLRRKQGLMMVVGFPGVGKTTMGHETSAMLREFWDNNPGEVDRLLREVLPANLVTEFKTMIENSKSFSTRMFREIVASLDGQNLHEEQGLGPEQLLALNTLYASLTSSGGADARDGDLFRSYGHMLNELSLELKERITFDDVVMFIRTGLEIPPDDRIFLSFFFDEANKSRPRPGYTVCWFQEMMSRYVSWIRSKDVHGKKTFVVMCAATTRFSVATLQGTSLGHTKSVFIPVPPLTDEECERVVIGFLTRLKQTVTGELQNQLELSEDMRLVISLSGGNPRILSYLVRAFATCSSEWSITPDALLTEICCPLTKEGMESLLLNAWKQVSDSYYANYMIPGRVKLILRAMQASLRGDIVDRIGQVLPGFSDNWGELESMGLVGLRDQTSETALTAALIKVQVSFSTLVLRYVFSLSRSVSMLSKLLPPLENSDWKVKEVSDLYTIMFMILLHYEVSGRSTFKLEDVLPRDWFIPEHLEDIEFLVPPLDREGWRVRQAPQLNTPQEFWNFMNKADNSSSWAFIGPRNLGTDSWLRLQRKTTSQVMILAIESKCCGCPVTLPKVSYASILDKVKKNLKMIVHDLTVVGAKRELPGSSLGGAEGSSLGGAKKSFGLTQVVFVYMSDQNVAEALEEHKARAKSKSLHGVARQLIIASDHPRNSPFSKMSAIRHMMVFAPTPER